MKEVKIMLKVASEVLELRGVATKTTAKGNMYYLVNCETEDGTAHQFYCPDYTALPQGMKKGDKVRVYFNVKVFDRQEKLIVSKVEVVK